MQKALMYVVLGVTMTIGSYIPVLFGASLLGGWSLLGTLIGGIVGTWIYMRVRSAGYLE